MLILSRRPGDAIVIDGGIRIVVLASGQRCVRLGIEAPSQVGIVREEVLARTEARIEGKGPEAGEAGAPGEPGSIANGKRANGQSAANGQ